LAQRGGRAHAEAQADALAQETAAAFGSTRPGTLPAASSAPLGDHVVQVWHAETDDHIAQGLLKSLWDAVGRGQLFS
ncbi:hypothetical protein G3I76_54985, partial [Streptomyces sp. SID11233]|nr:hypothetical protein [Streptomyces sp. SID11233]